MIFYEGDFMREQVLWTCVIGFILLLFSISKLLLHRYQKKKANLSCREHGYNENLQLPEDTIAYYKNSVTLRENDIVRITVSVSEEYRTARLVLGLFHVDTNDWNIITEESPDNGIIIAKISIVNAGNYILFAYGKKTLPNTAVRLNYVIESAFSVS